MSYAVVLLTGLSLAQPTSSAATHEYIPINARTIKLPIKYDKERRNIRQMKLFVARQGENTWYQEAAVPPDRDYFVFQAKEDGLYWFTMVEEDLQGRQIPADLTRTPPDLKVLIDTTPPRVRFTQLMRKGDEVVAEWSIEDAHPAENRTQVHIRPAGSEGYWQEVRLAAGVYNGVRFPVHIPQPIEVRVTAYDLAGNKGEVVQLVPLTDMGRSAAATETGRPASATGIAAASANTPAPTPAASAPGSTLSDSGAIPPPASLVPPPTTAMPSPPPTTAMPSPPPTTAMPSPPPATVPVGSTGIGPSSPSLPTVPTSPTGPPVSPLGPLAAAGPASAAGSSIAATPLPTLDARSTSASNNVSSTGSTVAAWSTANNPTTPHVEESRATIINYLTFDLSYEVESRGPSGLSRIDLWVTRDDGRTWMKWSQHDPRSPTLRVNLHLPSNPQLEGSYGFRVVPISGAGLSEREPVSGDAPELRVMVDITPPQVEIYPPVSDPQQPQTLLLQWKAIDKHWGANPIRLEWSDKPNGPWQPVVAGEVGEVQAVAGSSGPVSSGRWLPNTGSYAWRVPAGLPPRVYLKVTARDAAGNTREVVTRDPILVDLVKPKARLNGIVGPAPFPSSPAVAGAD
jgi:hypothetical protein